MLTSWSAAGGHAHHAGEIGEDILLLGVVNGVTFLQTGKDLRVIVVLHTGNNIHLAAILLGLLVKGGVDEVYEKSMAISAQKLGWCTI